MELCMNVNEKVMEFWTSQNSATFQQAQKHVGTLDLTPDEKKEFFLEWTRLDHGNARKTATD
jgi:hypothetical protein